MPNSRTYKSYQASMYEDMRAQIGKEKDIVLFEYSDGGCEVVYYDEEGYEKGSKEFNSMDGALNELIAHTMNDIIRTIDEYEDDINDVINKIKIYSKGKDNTKMDIHLFDEGPHISRVTTIEFPENVDVPDKVEPLIEFIKNNINSLDKKVAVQIGDFVYNNRRFSVL